MFLCVYISVQCMTGQTKMAYHRYSAFVVTLFSGEDRLVRNTVVGLIYISTVKSHSETKMLVGEEQHFSI